MSGETKAQFIIGQVVGRVIIAIIIVFGLFVAFDPAWILAPVRVGLHTLLAFLSFIGAAVVSYDIRKNSIVWKYFLLSVFMFAAIVNFVAAVWHLNPLYSIDELIEVTADLLEMMLLGLLLLGTIIPTKFTKTEINIPLGIRLLFALTFSTLLIYGLVYYFILPIVLFINPFLTGTGLYSISFLIYVAIFILLARKSELLLRWDTITFVTGLILMVVSTSCLVLSYLQPVILFSASVMIRATMMYSLIMAVALPVQNKIGIGRKRSYLHASGIAFLTFVPYFLTVFVVSIVPISWIFPEQGIYSLTHLIVAILAAIITQLLWLFTKQKPHWHRYPMILIFVCLTILEAIIFILSPWVEITGEYTFLYILAGIMIVTWLIFTLHWIYHPPTNQEHSKMKWWICGFSIIMLLLIVGGLWFQSFLQTILFWMDIQSVFRGILLGVCFVSIFLLTYLFIIFLQVSKGKITMGIIVLGTVTLWVVANMIRINFVDWSAGWWIAQFLLLFGILMGPATLGRLYLSTLEKSETERKRATLYADILIHDLRNYHTAIQSSLDFLTLAQDSTEVVDEVTDQMQIALDRADRLITNVRSLELAKMLELKDLDSTDLVAVIHEAWDHVIDNDVKTVEFQVNRKIGECFVQANDLLLEVFINLFHNAIQHSKAVQRIHVDIQPVDQHNTSFWQIHVIDWGRGIPPEQKPMLFTRYSEGAKGFGLGLSVVKSLVEAFNGTITMENRVANDYTQGTVFIITLVASS